METTEKQLSQTKANFSQQVKMFEAESKQKMENAKSSHEEFCRQSEVEKVCWIFSFIYVHVHREVNGVQTTLINLA